jgi:hypothetical protein
MRFLPRKFAGHDLVGFAALAVEVENEFEASSLSDLILPITPQNMLIYTT